MFALQEYEYLRLQYNNVNQSNEQMQLYETLDSINASQEVQPSDYLRMSEQMSGTSTSGTAPSTSKQENTYVQMEVIKV